MSLPSETWTWINERQSHPAKSKNNCWPIRTSRVYVLNSGTYPLSMRNSSSGLPGVSSWPWLVCHFSLRSRFSSSALWQKLNHIQNSIWRSWSTPSTPWLTSIPTILMAAPQKLTLRQACSSSSISRTFSSLQSIRTQTALSAEMKTVKISRSLVISLVWISQDHPLGYRNSATLQ